MNSKDFCPEHPKLPGGEPEDPHGHVPSDGERPSEHGSAPGALADAPTPEEAPSKVGYIQNLFYPSCSILFSLFQQQQQQQQQQPQPQPQPQPQQQPQQQPQPQQQKEHGCQTTALVTPIRCHMN